MEQDRPYDDFTDEEAAQEAVGQTYEEILIQMRRADIESRQGVSQNAPLSALLFVGAALMAATQCNDQPHSTTNDNPVEFSVSGTTFPK